MGQRKKTNLSQSAVLQGAGLRATPQRIAILQLLEVQKKPVSAEGLVQAARGRFDVTTAYRTLDALAAMRVVRKVRIADDRALYEMADDHHHHAVCTSCGTICDISMCLPLGLDAKVKRAAGFGRIDSHSLEFFGLCKTCLKRA